MSERVFAGNVNLRHRWWPDDDGVLLTLAQARIDRIGRGDGERVCSLRCRYPRDTRADHLLGPGGNGEPRRHIAAHSDIIRAATTSNRDNLVVFDGDVAIGE